MTELFIGLMSGTSMDGIDAILVDFSAGTTGVIATHTCGYPDDLTQQLEQAIRLEAPLGTDLTALDNAIGAAFAAAANELLARAGIESAAVSAIGSHGQTIRHAPDAPAPYSLQIGNPEVIAAHTGIAVVADFRRADIDAGGQGAPLVPAFHQAVFTQAGEDRVVLNIGGIANITVLPGRTSLPVTGFDTGPGNTLLDAWARQHLQTPMDAGGHWAAQGRVDTALLARLLDDPYFHAPPPKSTGREYFNPDWLTRHLQAPGLAAQDVQATLCALTAQSILEAIGRYAPDTKRLLVCGGGVHNGELLRRLGDNPAGMAVESTQQHGVDPDWVEAIAFAWLAKQRLDSKPGNIPTVTGARRPVVLGSCTRAGHGIV